MGDIEKFYKNTKNTMPHNNVKKFIQIKTNPSNAIDLGCGAGRDTIFLIKNNWNVTAIDRENTRDIIKESLNTEELKKLNFKCQNFENIKLQKSDLIVSNFSIPFCNKNFFNNFWTEIVTNINSNRIFCW